MPFLSLIRSKPYFYAQIVIEKSVKVNLFVEKLTFEEPYQAIKFASKKDCYKYLTTKYKDYTGPGLAKPFIMDNGKWVDMD